jgi:subfamily B ATP-binding cassette protein MsbA
MQLLSWFFRTHQGTILFNDIGVNDWIPETFARNISFLTQQPFFMGYWSTILQNLSLWVENLDEGKMWEYLEKFWLAEKIRKCPEGINSEVWEKIEFSWGEKQILTFIRILLQNRPIVIMDEWTNQLDAENEVHVMNELLKQKKEKIIIFITHRMSTISKVDWIYCLEWWTLSASGNHSDLLKDKENPYSRFYRAQVLHEWISDF